MSKKPGGRSPGQKGSRFERSLVHMFKDAGIVANRIPSSGAAPGKFGGYDLEVMALGREMKLEAKHHQRSGFQKLYDWLVPVDMLAVRVDHSEPLVVMRWELAMELLRRAEGLPIWKNLWKHKTILKTRSKMTHDVN